MTRNQSPVSLVLIAIGAALFMSAPAAAAASALTCKADYDFCIEVNEEFPREARFYRSDQRGKFFIDIPSNQSGLLMDLQAKKIFAVPRDLITPSDADGTLTISEQIPAMTASYAFSIDGPIIRFRAEDKKVRVMPVLKRPPVVGPVELDALLADRPEYGKVMESYSPDEAAIAALSASQKAIEIDVFFGTWCRHCKMFMPKFLRVMTDVNNPNIKLNLIGVPQNFGEDKGPWQNRGITTIPAIIVKRGESEITRLSTHEGALPEVELAEIVKLLP
jgi:thiol-disulfide isomerase/thioredoxin